MPRELPNLHAGRGFTLSARCLVPESRDANLRRQVGRRYGSRSSWQRPNNAASSSRTPSVESDDERAGPALGLSWATVNKWRSRSVTCDAPMGPHDLRGDHWQALTESMTKYVGMRLDAQLSFARGLLDHAGETWRRASAPRSETKTNGGRGTFPLMPAKLPHFQTAQRMGWRCR